MQTQGVGHTLACQLVNPLKDAARPPPPLFGAFQTRVMMAGTC